jgi:subtilase family serine protease
MLAGAIDPSRRDHVQIEDAPSRRWSRGGAGRRIRRPGSAVRFTSLAQVTGDVAGGQRLTVQLWLKPDITAAERYAAAVATPGSALFHHYLSPAAYTARFGASDAAATVVESWLRGGGFTGITADSGRAYVRATGEVSAINGAFRIRLALYKASATASAGRYRLRANSRAFWLPAPVAARVLGVSAWTTPARCCR